MKARKSFIFLLVMIVSTPVQSFDLEKTLRDLGVSPEISELVIKSDYYLFGSDNKDIQSIELSLQELAKHHCDTKATRNTIAWNSCFDDQDSAIKKIMARLIAHYKIHGVFKFENIKETILKKQYQVNYNDNTSKMGMDFTRFYY